MTRKRRVRNNRVILEKTSGEEILDKFINQFEKKKPAKKIDWDELYYSQFKAR